MLKRVSLRMRFIFNLSFLNMQLVHTFRIPSLMESGSNFFLVLKIPYLLERGGEILGPIPLKEREIDLSPRRTNDEGPRIQRSGYGRIPR